MEGVKKALAKINTKVSERKLRTDVLKCAVCGKMKRIDENHPDWLYRHEQKYFCSDGCKKERKRKQLEKYSTGKGLDCIPKRFRNLVFRDKELTERLLANKSVFITGKTGVGKTVLMASIVRKYVEKGYGFYANLGEIRWISYPAFIMELQSLFGKDKESPFDYAEEVAKLDGILAVDDLGAEKLSDFVRQITYFIINEREQRELPVLITSNFSLQEIDEMIDPRISSRIAGICEIIKLSGKDRRISNNEGR